MAWGIKNLHVMAAASVMTVGLALYGNKKF